MGSRLVERIDGWTGQILERAVGAHHRRRLRLAGRLEQLEPPPDTSLWAAGHPPPREGNALDVLIDGEEALPRIAEALSGARSYVHIAGWHMTPDFGLTRDHRSTPLRDLLAEVAERVDVRVLLWGGSPLPVFKPARAAVRRVREELVRGSRVRCALDTNERPLHCHHEKLVIVDGEVAFVGGIDLTSLGGDRFDSSAHEMRGRLGWHDAATRLEGAGRCGRRRAFPPAGMRRPESACPPVARRARPARSSCRSCVPSPRTCTARCLAVTFASSRRTRARCVPRAVRLPRESVPVVAQVVAILAGKLREPPDERFRVVVLLPAKPNNGADDTRGQLGVLVAADDGAGRFLAATISARAGTGRPLYVHAKIGIVDDRWLTLGSANLNEHSLFNDTEMNVVTCDRAVVRETRLRLWAEHLERPIGRASRAIRPR